MSSTPTGCTGCSEVAHSIELLFDPDSDALIRSIWHRLDDAGLPSQNRVLSETNRPHVTLLAAQRIDSGVDAVLRELAPRLGFACDIGAPVVFTGPRMTLARLIVPSAELLALHSDVYRLTVPYVTGEPFGHCAPGHWTAHATLGRRFTADQIGAALSVADGADIATRLVGLRRWDGDARVDHLLVG